MTPLHPLSASGSFRALVASFARFSISSMGSCSSVYSSVWWSGCVVCETGGEGEEWSGGDDIPFADPSPSLFLYAGGLNLMSCACDQRLFC